jgi:hypothetical protein
MQPAGSPPQGESNSRIEVSRQQLIPLDYYPSDCVSASIVTIRNRQMGRNGHRSTAVPTSFEAAGLFMTVTRQKRKPIKSSRGERPAPSQSLLLAFHPAAPRRDCHDRHRTRRAGAGAQGSVGEPLRTRDDRRRTLEPVLPCVSGARRLPMAGWRANAFVAALPGVSFPTRSMRSDRCAGQRAAGARSGDGRRAAHRQHSLALPAAVKR